VFVSPGTEATYRERFPELPSAHFITIANGFDEEDFADAVQNVPTSLKAGAELVLVHSGILYPSERDPRAFLEALASMKAASEISKADLRVVFRASGSEDYYRSLLVERNLDDIVYLEPAIPYRNALREMIDADGLLVFQAANCNRQIPAKLYECLRAGRPILALTDAAGDTAAVLTAEGIDSIAQIDDAVAIRRALREFLSRIRSGTAAVAPADRIARHSRRAKTAELASLLDSVLPSSHHQPAIVSADAGAADRAR
jgi:glycosyltransferase involved in cell wall biosynthesis